MSPLKKVAASFFGLLAVIAVAVIALWQIDTRSRTSPDQPLATSSTAERGAYLARVGNCAGCHTVRGGKSYAGGLAIDTPFGAVYASNLTPDAATGIGSWTRTDFWHAMHHGQSKNGRLLYPAFPYTSYTLITREDSDALFAYLQSLPGVNQPNQAHTVRFPYDSQAALAVWRALYFKPGSYQTDLAATPQFNRGAYLVNSLGHCSACHAARNALGATEGLNLAGGLIPLQNWYAPSLVSKQQASVADWPLAEIVALFKTGVSTQASVIGPMAEVVLASTQHWSDADLEAMGVYLKGLPVTPTSPQTTVPIASARGGKLYDNNCAQCHGHQGQGIDNAYPALAGNRAVLMPQKANLVQIVLNGGYPPATAGNPRPYGMPPFVLDLDDNDIAALLSYIRNAWGNQASAVSALEVNRLRAGQPVSD